MTASENLLWISTAILWTLVLYYWWKKTKIRKQLRRDAHELIQSARRGTDLTDLDRKQIAQAYERGDPHPPPHHWCHICRTCHHERRWHHTAAPYGTFCNYNISTDPNAVNFCDCTHFERNP